MISSHFPGPSEKRFGGVSDSPLQSPTSDPSSSVKMDEFDSDNMLVGTDPEENYWREVKAIIGGVLGFWGGVGGLGTVFLVLVLSQRYCCKNNDEKDEDG